MIRAAHDAGKLDDACYPSNRPRNLDSNEKHHIDFQTPTNSNGDHKIAIQQNKKYPGKPSTIGMTVVNKNANATPGTVSFRVLHALASH